MSQHRIRILKHVKEIYIHRYSASLTFLYWSNSNFCKTFLWLRGGGFRDSDQSILFIKKWNHRRGCEWRGSILFTLFTRCHLYLRVHRPIIQIQPVDPYTSDTKEVWGSLPVMINHLLIEDTKGFAQIFCFFFK